MGLGSSDFLATKREMPLIVVAGLQTEPQRLRLLSNDQFLAVLSNRYTPCPDGEGAAMKYISPSWSSPKETIGWLVVSSGRLATTRFAPSSYLSAHRRLLV